MNAAEWIPPTITAETTLAAIALRSDADAAVLARHRLDFCCAGRRTLAQACAASGLDVGAVLSEMDANPGRRAAAAVHDWNARPLTEVVDFIVATHHVFARGAFARIAPLMAKVVAKHGERHPELQRIARLVRELEAELTPHMLREERVLFPYIQSLALEAAGRPVVPSFGTVQNPVRIMAAEHGRDAGLLAELAAATDDFTAPADACTSHRALFASLAELRLDLLRHVSLENNVLFPRAIALEERRRAA